MTAIALDFGTSNTVVFVLDPITQRPTPLSLPPWSLEVGTPTRSVPLIPSQVWVQDTDTWIIGEEVRSKRLGYTHPAGFFQGFKRDIAAKFRPPSRTIGGKSYDAETIAEGFLRRLWQQILAQGIQPSQVIFTVPVGAFEPYLDWFYDFSQSLALPSVYFVDESTAAALGYAVEQPGAVVLVVDFGGGTLDLSLVRTSSLPDQRRFLKAEVLAKSDAYVGGVDIDTWIADYFLRQWQLDRTTIGSIGWVTLLELAERLKITLSSQPQAIESWFDDEHLRAYDLELTQDMLSDLLESHQVLEQLRQALDEVLGFSQARGIAKQAIEQVLLVGGSCQIPAVQQLMVSYFGKSKVAIDKPLTAVAEGALLLATKVQKIDDFLRHSYAIRLWEPYGRRYSYFPLFEKGSAYPTQRPDPLILQAATPGQTEIRLDIGQLSDRAEVEIIYDRLGRMTSSRLNRQSDFRSLAPPRDYAPEDREVCLARLDPPGQVGVDRIEVYFAVNAQRILLATIKDLVSQQLLTDRQPIIQLE